LTEKLLTLKERLTGLYILCEIYSCDNVRTTPFYQLVLDLLASVEDLHVAEYKLLNGFLTSVPRVGKKTPADFIQEAEMGDTSKSSIDLEPYRKAHSENMPHTHLLHGAAVPPLLVDEDQEPPLDCLERFELAPEDLTLDEFLPCLLRPPATQPDSEDYILDDVRKEEVKE
jgi:hypothetical protein